MFTKVKTAREIAAMRQSGAMLAAVLAEIKKFVEPGCSGKDVSQLARQELKALGGKAAFFGYQGFPDVICISVNDEIVHGIPNTTPFATGDIVGFDFGVDYQGMITDAAYTHIIGGRTTPQAEGLVHATEHSLQVAIAVVKNGVKVGDIAAAAQAPLDKAKLGIIRDMVGHGVGHHVHEEPNIPNYGKAGTGPALEAGMTIAIEPMATLGGYDFTIDADGWTTRTADGSLSAHFEHTVLITAEGHEILTVI